MAPSLIKFAVAQSVSDEDKGRHERLDIADQAAGTAGSLSMFEHCSKRVPHRIIIHATIRSVRVCCAVTAKPLF